MMFENQRVKVSVVMSVFNEPIGWLRSSIESILSQELKEFEFIIILDNPVNEESRHLIESYQKKDSRIKFIENQNNIGLPLSLNKGISLAVGDYIARMDADDISLENRLRVQYEFATKQNCDLLASNIEFFGTKSGLFLSRKIDDLVKVLHYQDVMPHPTWFVRKDLYKEMGGYKNIGPAQDYEFLARCLLANKKIFLLDDVHLKYRTSGGSISKEKALLQLNNKIKVMKMIRKKASFDDCDSAFLRFCYSSSIIVYQLTNSKFLRMFCPLRLLNFFMSLTSPR